MRCSATSLGILCCLRDRCEFLVDLRVDLSNDGFKVKQENNAILHLDDTDDTRPLTDIRCRLHVFPRDAVNAVDAANEEADVVVVDLGDNDVLKLVCGLEVETARHIDERDRLSAQRKEPIDVWMCLGHCRHWCTRNDLTDLCDVDAVVHLPNAELNNLKFVRSCLKQDAFSLFCNRICHLSLSPMLVNIVCYALYSPFGEKILPLLIKN